MPDPPKTFWVDDVFGEYPMYDDHVELTACNQETETFRIERLNRVLGYSCAIADVIGNRRFVEKLAKLNDHKGLLEVTWRKKPTRDEKRYIAMAWESSIGDGCDTVEHEMTKP